MLKTRAWESRLTCVPEDCLLWPTEGDSLSSVTEHPQKQFLQQLHASQYLQQAGMPLTTDKLCETHRILWATSFDSPGSQLCEAGTLRTVAVSAGSHEFPDMTADEILKALAQVCERFNAAVAAQTEHAVLIAVRLLHELLRLHPFQNGNGLTARLLFTVALIWQQLPFHVALSSNHTTTGKAREHYVSALKVADDSCQSSQYYPLFHTGVVSVYAAVVNFRHFRSQLDSLPSAEPAKEGEAATVLTGSTA